MRMITSKYYSFDLDNPFEKRKAVTSTFLNFLDMMEKARIKPTNNQKRFAITASCLEQFESQKVTKEELGCISTMCQIIKNRFEFSLNCDCTQYVAMTIEDCIENINPGIVSMIVSYIAYKYIGFSLIGRNTVDKIVFNMQYYFKVIGNENTTMSFDVDKLNECWEAQKMHKEAIDNVSDNLVDYFDFNRVMGIFRPELDLISLVNSSEKEKKEEGKGKRKRKGKGKKES